MGEVIELRREENEIKEVIDTAPKSIDKLIINGE